MGSKSNSKYERRKFLDCRVILEKKIGRCTSSFRGTNGSGLKFHCKDGQYSSNNVTLTETSINRKILRIPLARDNLQELKEKLRRYKVPRPERKPRRNRSKSDANQNIAQSYQFTSKQTAQQRIQDRTLVNKQKNVKTINKVIKKPHKIKIKLFSRKHSATDILSKKKNGAMQNSSAKPLKIRREILFVKQYRNEKLSKLPKAYYLKFPQFSLPIDGKLNYKFQNLATDVKTMKLPTPTWKIKVIIRRNKISGITFTNKQQLERSLSFYAENDKYDIVIDNQPGFLLGSPGQINNKKDVEILLDIVQNIDPHSRMILYK